MDFNPPLNCLITSVGLGYILFDPYNTDPLVKFKPFSKLNFLHACKKTIHP